ncbi:MAG: hypothetical protein ACOX8V_07110 [Thermoleophilia bacterium]
MSLKDKLAAGAERAAKEAERALDKGKAKVGELQIEMQMDGQAKKLGYLVFDFYRGREIDQAERQGYLDELSRLEDKLNEIRAEAAAKDEAADEKSAQPEATTYVAPDAAWQRGPASEAPENSD